MITSTKRNFSNSTEANKSRDARNVGKTSSRRVGKAATVETLAIAGTNQQQG
jgi:hypothetical protein